MDLALPVDEQRACRRESGTAAKDPAVRKRSACTEMHAAARKQVRAVSAELAPLLASCATGAVLGRGDAAAVEQE